MATDSPHGSGLLSGQEPARSNTAHDEPADDGIRRNSKATEVMPAAAIFEAPDWMKSYGMPLAISCSVGYSLVGLVMVEPAAPGAMFHPAAILSLLLFATGFVKGMQWWTTANQSGKAVICPRCGQRTRLDSLTLLQVSHTCGCGQAYSVR